MATRSPERLAAHYAIERELADRLRTAPREARGSLYTAVYDELFARVSDHPLKTRKMTPAERASYVGAHLPLLRQYLNADATFLEIGAGDAALSLAVAPMVRSVVAVDVCRRLAEGGQWPANFRFHLSRDTDLGVADSSVTLAYSNQLLEHLHPDDAIEHLRNVATALVPGGTYICVTPNRLGGPHDISRGFDPVATGLHLKEYSGGELRRVFAAAGFSRFEWHSGLRGRFYRIPGPVLHCTEAAVGCLPTAVGRFLANSLPLRKVLSGIVVAAR
jgi:SAM-dependent methyltransferase